MAETATTGDLIDALVRIKHGDADARTQEMYRQSLQLLVGMAKLEQRQETMIDFPEALERSFRGTMH